MDKYKTNLFELISKEDVVLWIGAGLSLYAGYPSGRELKDIIFDKLKEEEKQNIDKNASLPDFTEDIYLRRGEDKNFLIDVITNTFSVDAKSTEYHDKLAGIPHFKTIITTNYDKLIEDAYGNKAQKFLSSKDLVNIDNKKVHIFKAHGDFSALDSIVLTKSDYSNFFKEDKKNTTYWSNIKAKMSTSSVLFLGYNYEDSNITTIFDKIIEELSFDHKDCFLVAPKMEDYRVKALEKKKIYYIDSTAENFIDELIDYIENNIVKDFENNNVSAESLKDFALNKDVIMDLNSNGKEYKISSFRGANENVKSEVKFSLKGDKDIFSKYKDFASGKSFGKFVLTGNQIQDFDVHCGNIRAIASNEISSITLKSIPTSKQITDIVFDDGFELNNISTKIYGSKHLIKFELDLISADISIELFISKSTGRVNYEHKAICKNVRSEIELFTFLLNIASEKKATIFLEKGKIGPLNFNKEVDMLAMANVYLQYFKGLKIIENYFKIRFTNFEFCSIDREDILDVIYVMKVINGEDIITDCIDDYEITFNEEQFESLKQIFEKGEFKGSALLEVKKQECTIHNIKIDLGYNKTEILEPVIRNIKSVLSKEDNFALMYSKVNKVKVSFSKDEYLD